MNNKNFKTDEKIKTDKAQAKIRKMHKDGDFKKAVEFCQSVLKNDPTNPALHISLGDLYLTRHLDIYTAQQFIDETITEYQRALEMDLNSALIHYKIGVALYYKGNLDKAIAHFNLSIEYDENYSEAYYMSAKILAKKERYSEAFTNVKKAIELNRFKSSRARFLYGVLLKIIYKNNFSKQLLSFAQIILSIIILPFDKEGLVEFSRKMLYLKFFPIIFKGTYLEKTRDIYKAIDLYNEIIEKVPGFLPLYVLLGDLYRKLGRHEEAINEYKMALWIDPNNVTAYKSLCAAYEEQGDYDNAIDAYKKIIEIQPNDATLHSNLANILYMKGDFKNAISGYQNAITINPNSQWTSVIAQTLGYVLQENDKNLDAAISAYQNAFALNPNDIDIYVNLGSVFYDKSDYQNALTVYRSALEIQPDNARIHCNLAYLLWGKGDLTESIKEYEKATELDPNYDIAYNNLGVIYLDDLCQINKALGLFEDAISHNPNYALAYYNMGRAIALKGDKIEAARLYQIALDLNSITNELDNQEIQQKIDDLFN
ncbi:MAG: tetratricopeptide repeat protein [Candidatus Gastranaerophilales bacterium]|nr:tetratricopeptide repeat protein [Candidatus Gastranaerophilales bacterium]